MDNRNHLPADYNTTDYFADLVASFPNLHGDIDKSEGTHYNMEQFADYTIEQIKKSDFTELKKCFDFQEDRIDRLNADLENALNVSYCEALICYSMQTSLSKYMQPKLFKVYLDYKAYWDKLNTQK